VGGAPVAPRGTDELVRGLQHPALPGQRGQRLGVRGAHDPDAAVGGGRDPVPLVLVPAQALPGLGSILALAGTDAREWRWDYVQGCIRV